MINAKQTPRVSTLADKAQAAYTLGCDDESLTPDRYSVYDSPEEVTAYLGGRLDCATRALSVTEFDLLLQDDAAYYALGPALLALVNKWCQAQLFSLADLSQVVFLAVAADMSIGEVVATLESAR